MRIQKPAERPECKEHALYRTQSTRSVALTVATFPVRFVPKCAMQTSGQLQVSAVLLPRKNPRYQWRLGGSHSRSEGFGGDINHSALPPGIEPRLLDRPAHSAVTMRTGLSRITLAPLTYLLHGAESFLRS